MSVLTALPPDARANVIHFLVPNIRGKRVECEWPEGFGCPGIATGVASRKHRVWTITGYHWLKLQAWWIDGHLPMRVFAAWFNLTARLLGD